MVGEATEHTTIPPHMYIVCSDTHHSDSHTLDFWCFSGVVYHVITILSIRITTAESIPTKGLSKPNILLHPQSSVKRQ